YAAPLCPFFLTLPRPPTSALFPYTTLFRSGSGGSSIATSGQRRVSAPSSSSIRTRRSSSRVSGRATRRPANAPALGSALIVMPRSEEHTSELQSRGHLVCRLLLEKKKNTIH